MRNLALILVLSVSLAACSNPAPAGPTTVAGTNTTVIGTVVERLDGPPYSYLRLKTDKGEVWVALPMVDVKKRDKVTITHGAALKNFQAPRLGKKFDLVVFGTLQGG